MTLRGWCNAALGAVLSVVATSVAALSSPPTVCAAGQAPSAYVTQYAQTGWATPPAQKCALYSINSISGFDDACGYTPGSTGPPQGSTPTVWSEPAAASWTASGPNYQISFIQYTRVQSSNALITSRAITYTVRALCQDTCPASGTVMTTGRKSSKGIAQGNNQCYNGCQVTLTGSPIPRFTVSLEQLQGSGSFEDSAYTTVGNPGTQWIATGAACTTQPIVRDDGATLAGANATVGVKPNGCGEVNGEEFCASDLPAATNCAQSASGARVCGDSAPSPPVPIVPGTGSPAVPPSPENPSGTPAVPGTPAPPDAAMRADDGSGTTNNYNYYSSTTVNNGTTTGGTTSGGGTGGTTTGDSGGGVGSGGDCGAAGQPKCGVTVDGTGITEFAGGQQFDAAFGDPLSAMNDTKSQAEAGSEGIGDAYGEVRSLFDALLPPSSTCQSIPLTYFGITRSIPGERGCQLLEGFKEIANYIILMVCAAGIVRKFSEIYATSKV